MLTSWYIFSETSVLSTVKDKVHNHMIVLLGSRASGMNNEDRINMSITNMHADTRGSRSLMESKSNFSSVSILKFYRSCQIRATPENLHTTGQWIIWFFYLAYKLWRYTLSKLIFNSILSSPTSSSRTSRYDTCVTLPSLLVPNSAYITYVYIIWVNDHLHLLL